MKAYHSKQYANAKVASEADALFVFTGATVDALKAEIAIHEDVNDYVFYDLVPEQAE